MEIQKIKCTICYKFYKSNYKYQHIKTQHHIYSKRIRDDIQLKYFENLNVPNNPDTNINELFKSLGTDNINLF